MLLNKKRVHADTDLNLKGQKNTMLLVHTVHAFALCLFIC